MPAAASHRRYSSQNEGPRSFDRILFLVQMQPYPLTGGVSLRNWQNLNLLNAQGIVGIFSIYKGCPGVETLPQFAFWHHYDLTTPQRSLSEKVQRRLWPLRPAGNARSDWLYTHTVAQQLQQVLHTFQPDLIVIEEIWLYRYLPHLRRQGCPIILDNHNVEGDDSRYPAGSAMTPKKLTKVRFIEEQLIRQVDQVWMCSQPDVDQLHALYPRSRDAIAAKAQVIPNGINPDDYGAIRAGTLPPPPTLSTPALTLIYLGRYSYEPNEEAVLELIQCVFPAIKAQVQHCRLVLVGYNPTPVMYEAAAPEPNITITGPVDDVRPYLAAATVMVVPLRKGSGTRLKLLEAFAAKCPVVTTAKGAEGLDILNQEHLLLCESTDAMVGAILSLWQQPQQAQALANRAYQQFIEQYAWPAVGRQIQQALQSL